MKMMVNSEAIAVTLQKICTSSPSVRVSGSVTAGKLAEFHTRCSVPKMPQRIGQPAICTLCQSRVAQPFRGGAGAKARRQSNLLPAGSAHLGDFVSDLTLSRGRRCAISSIESPPRSMLPSSFSSASVHFQEVFTAGGSSPAAAPCGSRIEAPILGEPPPLST